MENAEEVFQILERFSKLKQKDIPKELDDYLCFVAKTGDTVYRWPMIKHLFREKLMQVIKDFYESTPSIADLPQDPNVDPFNYESMKNALLERLELFNAAPFTVQRICELLTDPRKQYSRIDKFMRAIEKNILVVSTTEPGRKRDSDENDITFADLTAKLTNEKVDGNATEAKENGSTDKPVVDMKDAVISTAVEPEVGTQPTLPSSAADDKKTIPADKPEETKPAETKESVTTTAAIINDKTTEMEEDKLVQNDKTDKLVQNDKPDKVVEQNDKLDIPSTADEAMPIEETKTEESSNIIVPKITVNSVPEDNGVVETTKVTENGGSDVELKSVEEIISTTPKSPCKTVAEITPKIDPISNNNETVKIEEKRELEDLLDEPQPKKLRTETNYATIPIVNITPSTPQKKEEEMIVEPSKEPEIIEKISEKIDEISEEPSEAPLEATNEPMKIDKIVEEKVVAEKSEVTNTTPIKNLEIKENESEIAQNGDVDKPSSITEVETVAPVEDKPESVDVTTTEKVEPVHIKEPIVEPKTVEDKPSEPTVEQVITEVAIPETVADEPIVEEPVGPLVTEEVTSIPPVVVEEPLVTVAAVAPEVEVSILPTAVDIVPSAAIVPVEEDKPTVSPIAESEATSIEVVPIPTTPAALPLTLIDAPLPVDESVSIPAPLSPMQSSETTQEMDTNSNENKMDADDLVDGSNSTDVATMINKAAADDNAMEVDESVEPMDQ